MDTKQSTANAQAALSKSKKYFKKYFLNLVINILSMNKMYVFT